MSQEKNRRGRIIDPIVPLLRHIPVVNDVRALVALMQNMKEAQIKSNNNKGTDVTRTRTNPLTSSQTAVRTSNVNHFRKHDVAFQDLKGAGPYEQRATKPSPQKQQLISAVVKDQIARTLGDAQPKPKDLITANPTSAARARLYNQMSGGALKSAEKPSLFGGYDIKTKLNADGTVTNARGQVIQGWDPNQLKGDLARQAVRTIASVVGGPYVQGALQVDNVIKGVTGRGTLEHHLEGQQTLRQVGREQVAKAKGFDPFDPSKLDKYLDEVFQDSGRFVGTDPDVPDLKF